MTTAAMLAGCALFAAGAAVGSHHPSDATVARLAAQREISDGAGAPSAASASAPGSESVPDPTPTTCTVYRSGTDLRVTITAAQTDDACANFAKNSSNSTAFWTEDASQANAMEQGNRRTVCSLLDGDTEFEVSDTGGAMYGQDLCGTLTSQGMTPADN